MSALSQLSRRVFQRLFAGGRNRQREMVRVLPEDAIRAIDEPVFEKPWEACLMTGQDRVIGLKIQGDVRAYPLNILSVHEIVNDVVGGVPVCVSWSPLSYSAAVYRRTVIDRPLTFAVSGSLLRNVQVMVDRETGTYWNQLSGDAFSGTLSGVMLEPVPAVLTTWQQWLAAWPSTEVLSKTKSPYGHYEEDHMTDYYRSEKTGIRPPASRDERLPVKEIILGTATEGAARVYPFPLLKSAVVLHDNAGGSPVVVFFDPESQSAQLYEAKVDGFALSFYEKNGAVFDANTGSRWSSVSGQALQGPLQGKTLQQLPSITAFWFAWADHFPDTTIYALPGIH